MDNKILVEKLLEKLNEDRTNRNKFYLEGDEIVSLNASLSGRSLINGVEEGYVNKDKTILKEFFTYYSFKGRYSYRGGFTTDGYIYKISFNHLILENINKELNKKIVNNLSSDNKYYKLLVGFEYTNTYKLKHNAIFKILKMGSGWDNKRELLIIEGEIYSGTKTLVATPKKPIIFAYDPYGLCMLTVKEYIRKPSQAKLLAKKYQ